MPPLACDFLGALALAAIVAFIVWSWYPKPVIRGGNLQTKAPPKPNPYAAYELHGDPPVIVDAVATPDQAVCCSGCGTKLPIRVAELATSVLQGDVLCLRCARRGR